MSHTRTADEEKTPASLTISVEKIEDQADLEKEPLSGSFSCESEPEDDDIPDSTEEFKTDSLDVLALAMQQDKTAIQQLKQLFQSKP